MPAPKGGPPNNPHGRPMIGKGLRPTLTARVDPDTLAGLKAYAAANGISLGVAVDDAFGRLDAWLKEQGNSAG